MNESLPPDLASWETVDSESVFDAPPWITVRAETVRLPDGREVSPYYRLKQPSFTVMAVIDDGGRFLAHWSYRHGPRRVTLGLPSGGIEPGETPLDAARRELLEEAGAVSDEWSSLGSFVVNSNQECGTAYFFLATNTRIVQEPASGDLEEIVPVVLSPTEIQSCLDDGLVASLSHATGIMLGLRALGERLAA